MPDHDKALRQQLTTFLNGEGAHITLADALDGLRKEARGKKAPNIPHTIWRLVEHIRLAQYDIVEFCTNPKYKEPKWPADYWPAGDSPESDSAWNDSLKAIYRDLERMKALVNDASVDLFAKIPWGGGQTYLREALLVADHNAYHVGEIVAVRRALREWPDK